MRRGELNQVLFKQGASSFRDASPEVRRGRNLLTKRIHRFTDQSGYWARYQHDGYPMQQIMRVKKRFRKYGFRLPNEVSKESCEHC